MEFRVLGPLEVVVDGHDVTPARAQHRTLLALLLLRSGEAVSTDEAIDALWGDRRPRAARNAVQGHVAALRKLLGVDRLVSRGGGYVLRVEDGELDLHRFERHVTESRGADAHARSAALGDALALFRGPPLDDLRDADLVRSELLRIDELRLAATEERIEAELELGHDTELVPELERLVAEEPFRERLRGQLIIALYRSGRQADALRAYQDARRTLVDELGIEPNPALQRLERQVLNQDQALDRVVAEAVPHLPVSTTPLRGRQQEIEELRDLLSEPEVRLLTVTGTGGSGKTRVALEVARGAPPHFRGGVFFVPLAPTADVRLVLPAVARALGVTDSGAEPLAERIAASARRRSEHLVLVDNFEHVLAAASQLSELLRTVPTLTLLVTSREPLRIDGEHVFRLHGLDVDTATALFMERARAVRPDIDGSAEALAAVGEICRRLDHLPLAIELAAARTTLFSPSALLSRLGERLSLLTGGSRDRPRRQQTLRGTLEWSYETLDTSERTLFARLAVFAGGWTLDAAQDVCGNGFDLVDVLASLVDKSLVQLEPSRDEPRAMMLGTIREFALERLTESGQERSTRDRHLAYFLALAERAYTERATQTERAFSVLDRDADNLRAAADWATRTDAGRALELVGALAWYWLRASASVVEGEARILAALSLDDVRSGARLRALLGLSPLVFARGRMDDVIAIATEALELAHEHVDDESASMALERLGWAHCVLGAHADARARFEESLEVRRRLDNPTLVRRSLLGIYQMLVIEGRVNEAEALALPEYEAALEAGDERGQQTAIHLLADCELIRGNYVASERRYATGVAYNMSRGDRASAAEEMQGVALSAAGQDDFPRALRLAGAAEAEWQRIGASYRYAFWMDLVERHLGPARAALGVEGAREAWENGAALSFDAAVEEATRSLHSLNEPVFRATVRTRAGG